MSHSPDESMDDINSIDTSKFNAITTLQVSPDEAKRLTGQRILHGKTINSKIKKPIENNEQLIELPVNDMPNNAPHMPTLPPTQNIIANNQYTEQIVDISNDLIGQEQNSKPKQHQVHTINHIDDNVGINMPPPMPSLVNAQFSALQNNNKNTSLNNISNLASDNTTNPSVANAPMDNYPNPHNALKTPIMLNQVMSNPHESVNLNHEQPMQFISPGAHRNNNIFAHEQNKNEIKKLDLQLTPEEIAKRSAEIYGHKNQENFINQNSNINYDAHNYVNQGYMPNINNTNNFLSQEQQSANTPFANQGPSTLINGLSFDNNKDLSFSNANSGGIALHFNSQQEAQNASYASTGNTNVIKTNNPIPQLTPEESASAFASALIAKAHKKSDATKIVNNNKNDDDSISTMIIKSDPPPFNNQDNKATKYPKGMHPAFASLNKIDVNNIHTAIIKTPPQKQNINNQNAPVANNSLFNFANASRNSNTILSNNKGILVSDELGHLSSLDDINKKQEQIKNTTFNFTNPKENAPVLDFTLDTINDIDDDDNITAFDSFEDNNDMPLSFSIENDDSTTSIANEEDNNEELINKNDPNLINLLKDFNHSSDHHSSLFDSEEANDHTKIERKSNIVDFAIFDDHEDIEEKNDIPTSNSKNKTNSLESAGYPDFFSAVKNHEDKRNLQILDVDLDAPPLANPNNLRPERIMGPVDLPDLPKTPHLDDLKDIQDLDKELKTFTSKGLDLESAKNNELNHTNDDNSLKTGPNLTLLTQNDNTNHIDNIISDNVKTNTNINQINTPLIAPLNLMVMNPYLLRCRTRANNNPYFTQVLNLSNNVVERFNLGFDPEFKLDNELISIITIPINEDSFVIYKTNTNPLNIKESIFKSSSNTKLDSIACFNLLALNDALIKPIFICDNELDALSLESLGYSAISIGMVGNSLVFIDILESLFNTEQLTKLEFYICNTQNDIVKNKQQSLTDSFKRLNIKYHKLDLSSPYNSINASLIVNKSQLEHKLQHLDAICDVNLQDTRIISNLESINPHIGNAYNINQYNANLQHNQENTTSIVSPNDIKEAYKLSAPNGIILCLPHLAKLSFAPLMYTISSPATALSRLVIASLIENQQRPILFVGSSIQWQMICNLLSFNTPQGYKAKSLDLEIQNHQNIEQIEMRIQHALMAARFSNMQQCVVLVDTTSFDSQLSVNLSPRLAKLAMEYCAPVVVWCSQEHKSIFESNSLQSIEMSQGLQGEVVFKTLDSSCRSYIFSTLKPGP